MNTSVEAGFPAQTFKLPPVLDLKAAAPLAEGLLQIRGADLTIDASDVEQLGGQCLQVLLSTQQTWRADETALQLVNPSSDFIECLRLFGLSPSQFSSEEIMP